MAVRLLLDTHALVWAVTDPGRLSTQSRGLIADASVPLLVSAVSAWEISLKHRAGKWPEVAVLARQFVSLRERLGAEELPLLTEHVLVAGSLEWHHPDPFDRALAAQAMREGLSLVTRDRALHDLPGLTCVW